MVLEARSLRKTLCKLAGRRLGVEDVGRRMSVMSMSGLSQTRWRFADGGGETWGETERRLREMVGLRDVERERLMPAEEGWG